MIQMNIQIVTVLLSITGSLELGHIFDGNALDTARFIFGAECDAVIFHEGWMRKLRFLIWKRKTSIRRGQVGRVPVLF